MAEKEYGLEAENVRTRINAVLKEKGLTENSVAAGDGATQSRLNSQLSHGKRITLDTVLRIMTACPDISADWLLRGIGEKYRSIQSITGAGKVIGENATVIGQQILSETFVRDLLAEKDKQIQNKDMQIQTLLELMIKNN